MCQESLEAQCARPRREHAADGKSPLPGVGQGPAVPGQFGLHWDNGKENGKLLYYKRGYIGVV